MTTTTPARTCRRGTRRRRALAALVTAGVVLAPLVAPGPATAAVTSVEYALENPDFAAPSGGGWSVSGEAEIDRTLVLDSGGVAYQPIRLADADADAAPAVGDVVTAQVDLTLRADVASASTVVVRLTDGASILSEWTDLSALPRGQRVTVTSRPAGDDAVIGAGASALWIELHNDTAGVIEVHDVRVSGVRAGTPVDYAVPNGDFARPLDATTNWAGAHASIASSLALGAGATASQSVRLGEQPDLPRPGDRLSLRVGAFLDPRAAQGDGVLASVVQAGVARMTAATGSAVAPGLWQEIAASPGADGNVVGASGDLELSLTNTTGYPLRLQNVRLGGLRDEGSDDLNGDGAVDARDVDWFRAAVAAGATDRALDYDRDGQVTLKDVSYFVRFILGDRAEVYANLSHLDFLSEHVELDGIPMMIVHLYAEPVDRSDPSRGYAWVGDPQEGVSALDDVARAVIVYAEHYATYRDAHSYDQMVRGLEFSMWMQAPNGDFDNFVARDADGALVKKHSASSQTAFSYWAARAYEAMATARPLIKAGDGDLASRLDTRLARSLDRVEQLVSPRYGQHDGAGAPAWLLFDDDWLSSVAISALVKHAHLLGGGDLARVATLVGQLAEGVAFYQRGDFDTYPLGAITHSSGGWYEWGSVQVKALALAGDLTGHREWLDAARLAADSFLSDLLISGRSFEIAPNKSGLPQINYGTASYVENLLTLFSITGERAYADLAGIAGAWWMGDNPLGVAMFDQERGLAFDGITVSGLNNNSGAESVDEALRAILRLQRVPEAMAMMTATRVEARAAQTVEFESLYAQGHPADEALALPDGSLNDPALARVTQSAGSGTDEAAIYADAEHLTGEQDVYGGWRGSRAIFVAGSGYNNVRLFDGGSLSVDVPVGGEGQARVGDALMLEFAALLQFQTGLDAEVFAVDAAGTRTLLADDADFAYNPRTWYSGAGAVRTTVRAVVPAGTDHLTVRFAAASTNTNPYEGYATVTLASLVRLGAPDVRYGSSALSGRAYAEVGANRSDTLAVDVVAGGDYAVFLSALDTAAAPSVSLAAPGAIEANATLTGSGVAIHGLGRATLAAGRLPLTVTTGGQAAGLDALILYPVRTWATYRRLDGGERMVLRDLDAASLRSGTPEELAVPPLPVWDVGTAYAGGAEVAYAGSTWRALWWTQGQKPGASYGAWAEVGRVVDGVHRAWTPTWVYTGGEVVAHDGVLWKASWWTRGQQPGGSPWGPWQRV